MNGRETRNSIIQCYYSEFFFFLTIVDIGKALNRWITDFHFPNDFEGRKLFSKENIFLKKKHLRELMATDQRFSAVFLSQFRRVHVG